MLLSLNLENRISSRAALGRLVRKLALVLMVVVGLASAARAAEGGMVTDSKYVLAVGDSLHVTIFNEKGSSSLPSAQVTEGSNLAAKTVAEAKQIIAEMFKNSPWQITQVDVIVFPKATQELAAAAQRETFEPSQLDQQPVVRTQTPPIYPFELKRYGTTGTVIVDFIVDTDGNVQRAFAAESSQREFETPAVQAVNKWRFKPGRKGGRDVNTHMRVPIVFSLNDR